MHLQDDGTVLDVHTDHLSTPRLITDPSGDVVWRAEYGVFGEVSVAPSSTLAFNVRLPGQYFDEDTGLHYNRYRYYQSKRGRYLAPDPIGQREASNIYVYARHSPVGRFDVLGLLTASEVNAALGWIRRCHPELLTTPEPTWSFANRGEQSYFDRNQIAADTGENNHITISNTLGGSPDGDATEIGNVLTHELLHTLQSKAEREKMRREDKAMRALDPDQFGPTHQDIYDRARAFREEYEDYKRRQDDDCPSNDGC